MNFKTTSKQMKISLTIYICFFLLMFSRCTVNAYSEYLSGEAVKNGSLSAKYLQELKYQHIDLSKMFVIGEVKIKNQQKKINAIRGTLNDSIRYSFQFTPVGSESYIYIYTFPGKIDGNRYLACLVFDKEETDWKLCELKITPICYHNLYATDYRWRVKELMDRGDYVNAKLYANIEAGLLQFSNKCNFHYELENVMIQQTVAAVEAFDKKFSLPVTIDKIKSLPKIVLINVQLMKGTFYPIVLYNSSINVNDTTKLKAEYVEVCGEADHIFPELRNFSDMVVFRAVNDYQQGKNSERYHEFYAK